MDDSETLAALREACRDWLRFDNDLDPNDPDTDIFAYEREKMEITERVAALVYPDPAVEAANTLSHSALVEAADEGRELGECDEDG